MICARLLQCDILLIDIVECSSNPCMNGATCTDAVNSYTCACVAGYTGTHCETGECLLLSNLNTYHTILNSILFVKYLGRLCNEGASRKKLIKFNKVQSGESIVKTVWLMVFINDGEHNEESLPNTN